MLDYFYQIDAVLLVGEKCIVLNDSEIFDLARFKGPIIQKLEAVQFETRLNPRESAIEQFLKTDLNKFLVNAPSNSLSERNRNVHVDLKLKANCDIETNLEQLPVSLLIDLATFHGLNLSPF